jgi:hypothetical protein
MLEFSNTASVSLSRPGQNVDAAHIVNRHIGVLWVLADLPGTGSLKIRLSNSVSPWLCCRLAGRHPLG